LQRSGCGLTTITAQTWPWAGSHPSSGWPWLRNVSTSATPSKGGDYHGIYFWEGNPARAQEWAELKQQKGEIETPFVVGAIIDLRRCLDLFDKDGLRQVQTAHEELEQTMQLTGTPMPVNVGNTPDKAGRKLDCLVLNYLHEYRKERREEEYDSVRGPFLEGAHLYPNAGFRSENHIQLCIRSTVCIKGYFRPIKA
jgi:hypothetical protein